VGDFPEARREGQLKELAKKGGGLDSWPVVSVYGPIVFGHLFQLV
jgi:hypothetical protein